MMDRRMGAQLYTVRDTCQNAADFDKTLARLEKIGYKTVQISGVGPISAQEIREICDRHGMDIICTHRGIDDYRSKLEEMVEYHKTLGCVIPGLGMSSSIMEAKTAEEVMAAIEELNVIAEHFAGENMHFCYHNHAFEFTKINGKFAMDYMLEYGKFDFILDVYWLAVAGQNPAEFIRKIGKRARVVHFKDLKMDKNTPVYGEVMEGNLDWNTIVAACDEAGTQYAMVEQDVCPGDPADSLEISYNNLKTLGFN